MEIKQSKATLRRADRMDRMAAARQGERVWVGPVDDAARRLLKHPSGVGFGHEGDVEWPSDRFTRRRLAEGDIKLSEPQAG